MGIMPWNFNYIEIGEKFGDKVRLLDVQKVVLQIAQIKRSNNKNNLTKA